jgi:hypothetical protein
MKAQLTRREVDLLPVQHPSPPVVVWLCAGLQADASATCGSIGGCETVVGIFLEADLSRLPWPSVGEVPELELDVRARVGEAVGAVLISQNSTEQRHLHMRRVTDRDGTPHDSNAEVGTTDGVKPPPTCGRIRIDRPRGWVDGLGRLGRSGRGRRGVLTAGRRAAGAGLTDVED